MRRLIQIAIIRLIKSMDLIEETVTTTSSASKWVGNWNNLFLFNCSEKKTQLKLFQRFLVRQHSEKISDFAEDVVLPKNVRLLRQASRTEDIPMDNIEAQYTRPSTASLYDSETDASRHFPIFMFTISLIQVQLWPKVFLKHFILHSYCWLTDNTLLCLR